MIVEEGVWLFRQVIHRRFQPTGLLVDDGTARPRLGYTPESTHIGPDVLAPWKMASSTNQWFSGSMLVFQSVNTYSPDGDSAIGKI